MRGFLTAEMQRALAYAESQGGKLYRHPGGFWGHQNYLAMQNPWFGATTIQGLVARELASYTVWQRRQSSKGGHFPVELTIKEKP